MSVERRVVVGVGNRFRGDDGAGVAVVDLLRDGAPAGVELLVLEGEPTTLLDVFDDAGLAILVDAVATAEKPGRVHRFDATAEPVPGNVFGASTHAFGLGETIELARTLGRLHGRVLVYGITGENFAAGEALGASVAAAARRVSSEVLLDLADPNRSAPELSGAEHA